ncbi:MAG: GMP synthase [Lentisphaeria bacterium]|nr:GMP synthase [Lentisphaeria bacterium]NQZ70008.1 GMP synthase [Lentisphaeria bacterium]
MKVALLQCDHVRDSLVEEHGDYDDMFKRYLGQAKDIELEIFDVMAGQYPAIDAYEAFLLTGSAASVYDGDTWILVLIQFIKTLHEQKKKTVGICFGHQLIAYALGACVEESERGWGIGSRDIQILYKADWMNNEADLCLLYSHRDQVETLPEGAVIIAGSSHCPIAVYQIGSHILGIQGHPEFSADYAEALMEARLEIIPSETIKPARESLTKKCDNDLIRQWILRFISS